MSSPPTAMICYDCNVIVQAYPTRLVCPFCGGDQFDTVGRTVMDPLTDDDVRPRFKAQTGERV